MTTLDVLVPRPSSELDAVRDLIQAFVAWHRSLDVDDLHLIDRSFSGAEFEDSAGR